MDDDTKKNETGIQPIDEFRDILTRTMDDRLNAIEITTDKIYDKATGKAVLDGLIGILPGSSTIKALINFKEDVDKSMKEKKIEVLLTMYFNISDRHEDLLNQLKKLLTHPQGYILYNKILQILDNSPPEKELMMHLSTILYNMSRSDFEKLFDDHKFILSQIEGLSPHSISIIYDNNIWPHFFLRGVVSSGGKISSPWTNEFSKSYASVKLISAPTTIKRIGYSINDLDKKGLIEIRVENQDQHLYKAHLTDTGADLLSYLKQNDS